MKKQHQIALSALRSLCKKYGMIIRPTDTDDDSGISIHFMDMENECGAGGHGYETPKVVFSGDINYMHETAWDIVPIGEGEE